MISAGWTKFSEKLALKPRNFRRLSSFCSVHRKAQRPSKRPIESPWHDMTCAALTGWSGTLAHATRVPGNATKIEEDTKQGCSLTLRDICVEKIHANIMHRIPEPSKYFPEIWAHKHAQCQSRFSLVVSCCGAAWFGSKTWWISFMHSKTWALPARWGCCGLWVFAHSGTGGLILQATQLHRRCCFDCWSCWFFANVFFFCISRLRWRKSPALGLRHECQEGGHFCKTLI